MQSVVIASSGSDAYVVVASSVSDASVAVHIYH